MARPRDERLSPANAQRNGKSLTNHVITIAVPSPRCLRLERFTSHDTFIPILFDRHLILDTSRILERPLFPQNEKQECQSQEKVRSEKHRASTAQSTEYGARSTEHGARNTSQLSEIYRENDRMIPADTVLRTSKKASGKAAHRQE